MKKITIFLLIYLCIGFIGKSQICYTGKSLLIGESETTLQNVLSITGFDGLKWQNSVGNFLTIDLRDETHISGTADCVKFFDFDEFIYSHILAKEVHQLSDMRVKTNIARLDQSRIMELNPVTFKWRDGYASNSAPKSPISIGLIAQEVQEIYPEIVSEDDMGNLMINYQALIPILIKSLQELHQKVSQQSAEINELLNLLDP